jgi:ketosteroid isomerase-like protein
MKTPIPAVLESYFQASNADDMDVLVSCFSSDATVVDENQTHRGTAEIKGWAINVRKKYEFKTEIVKATKTPAVTIVTAKVYGSFPGSPVDLDFRFTLNKNKITSLEIG